MSRQHYTIKVYDKDKLKLVDGKIFQGIAPNNIDDYNQLWLPLFKEAIEKRTLKVQDAHWDWGMKVEHTKQYLIYKSFALEVGDITQGLMILDTASYNSRTDASKSIVYLDYIATAPWNREYFDPNPSYSRYRMVGRLLLMQAIEESKDLEYKGRIGLHSLPSAESWYIKMGFCDLGFDSDKNMRYFELTENEANKLLKEMGN